MAKQEQVHDLVVVGGGAAGFFGAIAAAEHGVGDIVILEKTSQFLTKVRISGGGRCNVTHASTDPQELVGHYPRGHRSLLGPFYRWQATDTVDWFEARGIGLKTEADGRIFPDTDDSQTIIDCLCEAARDLGIEARTRTKVSGIDLLPEGGFSLRLADGESLKTRTVLVATGGIRTRDARLPIPPSEHPQEDPVPSLFTFHIEDERLEGLSGITAARATVRSGEHEGTGPVLITHWGLSGPAILKLSAWAARDLASCDYRFPLTVDWTGGLSSEELRASFEEMRTRSGSRTLSKRSPVEGIPNRLWASLSRAAGIEEEQTWSNLKREQAHALVEQLTRGRFPVTEKSLNKEEFVTCGGVCLTDVRLSTMESKHVPGLYFAGEVLDIDGVTGGFNFQAAWTTGRLAGEAVADMLSGVVQGG